MVRHRVALQSTRPAEPRARLAPADDEDWLADIVARLRRALRRQVRTGLPTETLSVAQIEIMQSLADQPGLRASELAERLLLAPTTVSTLLGQLLTKGVIERHLHPGDRRAWTLNLTSAGRMQLERWQTLNKQSLSGAMAQLNMRDRRAIHQALPALERLVAYLDDDAARR